MYRCLDRSTYYLDRSVVRTEYLSALRTLLTKPLARAEAEGQDECIARTLALMDEYCISREQVWREVWRRFQALASPPSSTLV